MKRYVSLDVLRGLTVTFMCIVNNPGSWSAIFAPLRHASWDGCTPTDLVYPFFVFCMGVAMAFSFSKFTEDRRKGIRKVMSRGVALFLVGLGLNLFPFFPLYPHDADATFGQNWIYWIQHVRIFGVLQRIGLAYLVAGLIALWLRKPGKIMAAIAVLLTVYTGILVAFGDPAGPFTLEGNVSGRIDTALLGSNHVYHGYRLDSGERADFDPEGLIGCLSAACTALLGYLIGGVIYRSSKRHSADPSDAASAPSFTVSRIFVYGMVSLALSQILSIWIPVNKPLWSASYVFYAGGWAMLALAFLAFVIDVKGTEKPFRPFKIMGTNALMAFVFSGVIGKLAPALGFYSAQYFGANEYMSLLYALSFAALIFVLLWLLYRKNIVIKL